MLEANPAYRAHRLPDSVDPAYAAMVREMKGKRLPQIGRIEFSVIEENQTRLLEFERGNLDFVELKGDGAMRLLKDGELDPVLAKRGIRRQPYPLNSVRSVSFNMEDPIVGGIGREQIALRRAIALGFDVDAFVNVVYGGQALPAMQILPPGVIGFDQDRARRSRYDPVTANKLLDAVGYDKRDKEGFRLAPDGKPLLLTMTTFTGTVWREMQTLWKKNMDALGVRMVFRSVPTQDLFKESAQGRYQLSVHGRSSTPMGLVFIILHSKQTPETNDARFRLRHTIGRSAAYVRTHRPGTHGRGAHHARHRRHLCADAAAGRRRENASSSPGSVATTARLRTYYKYVDIDSQGNAKPGRADEASLRVAHLRSFADVTELHRFLARST